MLAPQPRYRQLAQSLVNEIQSGRYPVGSLLPTEFELCAQFGASRFTIREAMKQLVQMGLVARHAGVGSRVQATAAQSVYRQSMEALSDLYQYSADTHLYVAKTERVSVDGALAENLRSKDGALWLRAEGVRRVGADAPPFCYTELYVHPAFSTVKGLTEPLATPVFTLIEKQFGERIAEVQQDIRAVTISRRIATLLQARTRAPALLITRRYFNSKRELVEHAVSTHPADRFFYAQTFKRNWQAG